MYRACTPDTYHDSSQSGEARGSFQMHDAQMSAVQREDLILCDGADCGA